MYKCEDYFHGVMLFGRLFSLNLPFSRVFSSPDRTRRFTIAICT